MKTKIIIPVMLLLAGNISGHSQNTDQDGYLQKMSPILSENFYIDISRNILSENVIYKAGSVSTFRMKDYSVQAGFLGAYSDNSKVSLKSWFVSLGADFKIKKAHFEVSGFYRNNPFSRFIHEINWGITLGYNSRHFSIKLGNNYRIYKLQKQSVQDYDFQNKENNRIVEPRNIMYSFTYFVMPVDHKWNAALTLTNFDHFLVQQETNPMGSCKFSYNISSKLKLYSELWYQNAGMLNLQVSYFGFTVRTGLVWNL